METRVVTSHLLADLAAKLDGLAERPWQAEARAPSLTVARWTRSARADLLRGSWSRA